jgi:hypothetical protein
MVLSRSVGTKRMRINTQFCGILTFASRSHLSVGVDERKHLGENHQKLAIAAANLGRGGNKKAAMKAASTYDGLDS